MLNDWDDRTSDRPARIMDHRFFTGAVAALAMVFLGLVIALPFL